MLASPLALEGASLGQRRRHFNALVAEAAAGRGEHPAPSTAPLERLVDIAIAARLQNLETTLQALRDPDLLYVTAALRPWLLHAQHRRVFSPQHLEQQLYPQMCTTAVSKTKHYIQRQLRDAERCREFFEYYCQKELQFAIKFLPHCSRDYILSKATDILDKLTPFTLKLLCEKCPEVAKLFFDSFSVNEKVLSNYLDQDAKYYNNMRFLLTVNADIFLDITEKHFYGYTFNRISAQATKYVMRNCKERFENKPELYTAWLLNVETLAKFLSEDEIKDTVMKLARADYLSDWFSYKNVEPLIKRLNVKERADFKKLVFVDKSIGDKVTDWPYEPPQRLSVKDSESDIFQDKGHLPREDADLCRYQCLGMCSAGNAFKSSRHVYESCDMAFSQPTALDHLFDRYRFDSFEKVLFELKTKMTVESQQNRQNMMLVLVSKTGGRAESVHELLTLLLERHENEPVHLRATVARSLVRRASAWRLPPATWDLMLRFGRDLGLDGKPPAAACVEGIHAVVLRNMLLDRDTDTAVWDAFLKDFSKLKEYSLTAEEQKVVATKLPTMLLNDAKANPSDSYSRIDNLLDTLEAYQIPANRCPELVSAVTVTVNQDPNAKPLLHRLFNARIARKELFKENFAAIQTDASYFNAIKHDAEILKTGKEFESLLESGDFRHERFLRTLALYFGERNGLAEKYLSLLEKDVDVSTKKKLARPLALLAGDKLVPLIKKLDSNPKNSAPKLLSAALRANIHLSRPLLDLETIGWRLIGAKAVANRVLTCSSVNAETAITTLLSWKRTHRLALVLSIRLKREFEVFGRVASIQPKIALKTALYHARHEAKLDSRVWDIIIPLIAKVDLSGDNNESLRTVISNLSVVPSNRKAEYCTAVFTVLKNISSYAALPILCELERILSEIDEQYIEKAIKNFLENEFTETCVVKRDFEVVEITRLYVRIIAKFLLLCKSENTQRERLENVGKPFIDQMESLWGKYGNDISPEPEDSDEAAPPESVKTDLTMYMDDFLLGLKYTDVFLDIQYVSCLPVFERVTRMLQKCVPIELNFKKYVHLHLTMLYFKSIRQSVKNNPEIFGDKSKKLNETVELVGVIFGKYVARELKELQAKYFESIFDLYKHEFMDYLDKHFEYGSTKGLLTASIIKGILESQSSADLLAEYMCRRQHYQLDDSGGEEIFERLKKSEVPEVKYFLYADFYND